MQKLSLILTLLASLAVSHGMNWYYTGMSRNFDIASANRLLNGSVLPLFDLFPCHPQVDSINAQVIDEKVVACDETKSPHYESLSWHLYAGQLVYRYNKAWSDNLSSETEAKVNISSVLTEKDLSFIAGKLSKYGSVTVLGTILYDLAVCLDYANEERTAYQLQIGLLNQRTRRYEKYQWIDATIGKLIAVVAQSIDPTFPERSAYHYFLYTSDGRNFATLMHTIDSIKLSKEQIKRDDANISQKMRVITYNIWHNNPPAWKFPDPEDRLRRYQKRMRHWAKVVATENPDVILLQEVRIDSSFPIAIMSGSESASSWRDYGSQIDHILRLLHEETGIAYHYVYHPGMLHFDRLSNPIPSSRIEEGLAILSRYPIEDVKVLLLPRNMNDPRDDHQRIVLKTSIRVFETTGDGDASIIDAFNTHLSLSERARYKSMEYFMNMASIDGNLIDHAVSESTNQCSLPKSRGQIFGGDFNAEASEEALQFITRNAMECLDRKYHSTTHNLREYADSSSTWTTEEMSIAVAGNGVNNEANNPSHEAQTSASSGKADGKTPLWEDLWCSQASSDDIFAALNDGLTFPAHIPTKRIDFLFIRNISSHQDVLCELDNTTLETTLNTSSRISAIDIQVVGKDPLPGLAESLSEAMIDEEGNIIASEPRDPSPPDLLNPNGPVWASDHYGVVANVFVSQ